MATVAPFGSWTSNITPDTFAQGNCKGINEIQANKDGVFWVEQNTLTGRRELFFEGANGRQRWAPEQSVQNCVHEYGGGSFVLTPEGGIVYSTIEGVFEQSAPTAVPVHLAPAEERKKRYADFAVTATHVFCVYEVHKQDHEVDNFIAVIDRKTKELQILVSGADFYACPRVSNDGKRLAWMEWNHINMPWDETTIKVASILDDGSIRDEQIVKSGVSANVNYHCPDWAGDGSLLLSHDATGVWNLYCIGMDSSDFPETNLYPSPIEIGLPLWQFGDRRFAINENAVVFRMGSQLLIRRDNMVHALDTPGFTSFSHLSITADNTIYTIASGPSKPSSLLKIIPVQAGKTEITVIRRSINDEDLVAYDISEPREISFKSDGVDVSGFFYEPKNRNYSAPQGTLPPVMLLGHGGPTAAADDTLDMRKQFFTTRGFAVFDVNYRGSTGCGSKFRHALKRQWGIVDRDDMINGAKALIDMKLVDPKKVCIRGSSAGGYLLLSALQHSDVFKAAVSVYGVADLVGLAQDTHKFEKGYNEALLGKFPEESNIYDERSPINHIEKLCTPIAFMHGLNDTVVPVSQSVTMYEKMKERGITTSLMLFENEGHGFRGADAIRNSVEATYYFLCKAMNITPSVESKMEIVNLK